MLIWWRVLFFAALALTAYATLSPLIAPPVIGSNDKLVHCLIFGVDTALGLAAFPSSAARRVVGIGLILFGVAIESMQAWVPHRQPSMGDALANAFGVSAAVLIWRIAAKRASKASPRDSEDSTSPDPRPPAPDS